METNTMSDYQPKDLTGCLFRNLKKERQSQPDYTGYVVIGGERFSGSDLLDG